MTRILAIFTLLILVACDDEDRKGSREVVSLTAPSGQNFHFMPIYEDGVSDITVRIAWPTNWSRTPGINPTVPYIGADLILSGGTEALKPQDIMEKFNDMNAQGFLQAGPDHVVGELSFPREHIDETVEIASEMMTNPQLDDAWLERIMQGFISNQKEALGISSNLMWSAAIKAIFGDTPLYESLALTDVDAAGRISRQDVFDWHSQTFTKSPVSVVVTGAISAEDAGRVVDKLLAGLPEGAPVDPHNDAADFSPVTVLLHLPQADKTTLGIIGQLPPTPDGGETEDLYVTNLLSSGPLFEAIRTELRATYGFSTSFTNYTRALRPLIISGEVEPEVLAEVRDMVLKTYEEFRRNPDLAGLPELKERFSGGAKDHVQYVNQVAQVIMELALDGRDTTQAPNLHALFEEVTAETVKARLIDAFPPASELMVFAVSPDANALPGACVITTIEQAADCR